jgi:homoserine kinase
MSTGPLTPRVTIRVPGSTSNCGAGFDTLGLALSVYNRVSLQREEAPGAATGWLHRPEREADGRADKMVAAAAEAFSRLAAEHPSSPLAARAQVTAGRALMEAGRTDDARMLFEKLAAGDGPEAFDAAHQLVALEIKAKRPDRGVEVAKQALAKLAARKDADRTVVAKLELDRADALWEVPARRPQAAAAYTAVAANHPDTPSAVTAMSMAALALLELQKPAESLAQADAFLGRHAATADPKTVLDVRTIRAEALLAVGKTAEAAAAFHELAATNPDSARRPAWELREAAALAAGGQWQKAHELLARSAPRLAGEQPGVVGVHLTEAGDPQRLGGVRGQRHEHLPDRHGRHAESPRENDRGGCALLH